MAAPEIRRVLMSADAIGGVWTYALALAAELARKGVGTTIATMGEPLRPAQRAAAARVANLRIAESSFRLEWMQRPWEDVALAGDWLRALDEREQPDLVHLNGYAHAQLPWRAPCLVVAHSCVFSWWRAVRGDAPPPQFARYREEVARGLQAADAVVAPTSAMLRAVREHYGPPLRSKVIANGFDADAFAVGPKQPFVLAAGRLWDEAKNLRALAAIAPKLRWPVYVAGSDTHPQGGSPRYPGVRALGWLDATVLREWMSRASIYAFPAKYEPFGLSVLEAALSGCALVLGDIESLREVWGDAALFVPPDDTDALRDAIDRLQSDARLRAALAASARLRAEGFSAERMARRYLDLYRELIVRHSSDRRMTTPPRSPGNGGSTVNPCA